MPTNPHFKNKDNKSALDYIKDNTSDNFQQIKALLGDYVEVIYDCYLI